MIITMSRFTIALLVEAGACVVCGVTPELSGLRLIISWHMLGFSI